MAIMGMKASVAVNVTNPDTLNSLLVSLRFVQDVAKGTRPFYRHPIFVVGLFTAAVIAILYWFSARSWAALSGPPAPTPTWHGPGASIPTLPRCWAW